MTFVVPFVILWSVLLFARETSIGRFLHRWMVERPAGWLAKISRGQAIVLTSCFAIAGALIWFEQGEALRLMGMASPELLGWLTMFEVSTFADVVAVVALAWSNMRGGPPGSRFTNLIRRLRGWFRLERPPPTLNR